MADRRSDSDGSGSAESGGVDARRFRALATDSLERISEVDRQGRILWASANHEVLAGLDPKAITEHPGLSYVHEDDVAHVARLFEQVFGAREPARATYRARTPQAGWRWIETTATPFEAERGEIRALLVSRDVSEARQVEERLAESERRLRLMMDNAYDVIAVYGEGGRLLYANPRSREVFGWTSEQLAGALPDDLVHPDDRERVQREMEQVYAGNDSVLVNHRVKRADGRWCWIESNARSYRTESGEQRIVVVARDVSEREEAASRIRESEERYRSLVENASEAIVVIEEGFLRFANPAAVSLFGVASPEDVLDRPALDFLEPASGNPEELAAAFCRRATETSDLGEMLVRGADGRTRVAMASGSQTQYRGAPAFQAVLRDVTELREVEGERQRLANQLLETRRLESLGVLAGGVAHDFNNLLQVILTNARMSRREASGEAEEMLGDVVDAAESAARLTRQLLAYAGRGRPDVRPVRLADQVQALSALLEAAVPKKTSLRLELDPATPAVLADVAQLEQVTMNLVRNGAEALGHVAGEVLVRCGVRSVGSGEIESWLGASDLTPGEYAYLEVRDDGEGMDADTRARIFDPFFTTKADGHGLGLSTVLGLVRAHGGGLSVDSTSGEGTTFQVYLPVFEGEPTPVERPAGEAIRLDATVLVVDDEPGIRRLARRLLRAHGCETIEAADGDEALEVFLAHADTVDIALLDLSMPRRSGLEVLRDLRRERPDLPVLLASGYDQEGVRHAVEGQELTAFIEKPYRDERLLECIRSLLRKASDS